MASHRVGHDWSDLAAAAAAAAIKYQVTKKLKVNAIVSINNKKDTMKEKNLTYDSKK